MDEQSSVNEEIRQLQEEFARLTASFQEQAARIELLERELRVTRAAAAGEETRSRPTAAAPRPTSTQHDTSPPPPHPPPVERQSGQRTTQRDLESMIGGSWFNRIGIIAVTLGVGFFLKYAFDNQWIGGRGRVAIGLLTGCGFLFAADRLRQRNYYNYANGLAGGGILMLYLSVAAAFSYYALIGYLPAFILLGAITATAVFLAARFNAQPIAALGLIGGFCTPLLLTRMFDDEVQFFIYLTVLDAGVLALAYRRGWRGLNYTAFLATVIMFLGWVMVQYQSAHLALTFFFLTGFFAIFTLIIVLNNIVKAREARWLDVSLIFGSTSFYYGTSYLLLKDRYHAVLGLFALLLAAFYVWLGTLRTRRTPADRLLFYTLIGVAIILTTVALPVQLNKQWLTIAWGVEGTVLTWIGLKADNNIARYWSLPVFLIAILHWLSQAMIVFELESGRFVWPIFNSRAISGLIIVACLGIAASLYSQDWRAVEDKVFFKGLLGISAHLMALAVLSVEALDYFENLGLPLASQLSLSIIWAGYGGVLLLLGLRFRDDRGLRLLALILLSVTTVKVFLLDLAGLNRFYRIISFIVLGAVLLTVSFFYQKRLRAALREP